MPLSSRDDVRTFYNDEADGYNDMMNEEIKLPLYDEVLSSLTDRISVIDGLVLDTSYGSGHMLEKLGNEYTHQRQLLGLDLSPKMVAIARERLGDVALISLGDMRDLAEISDDACAAVISFFSLHHIGADELVACFAEWYRVLVSRAQLNVPGSVIPCWILNVEEVIEILAAAGYRLGCHGVLPRVYCQDNIPQRYRFGQTRNLLFLKQ